MLSSVYGLGIKCKISFVNEACRETNMLVCLSHVSTKAATP